MVEIVIHEGRNRVVRRLLEEVGHPVTRLLRTQIGPIKLGDLRPGRTRVLGKAEVGSLMTSVGM
jgi:23S rRNA pseudouridine2605 synthase